MTAPAVGSFPTPGVRYDQEEESAFRLEIERRLQEIESRAETKPVSGAPATLASGNNNDYDTGEAVTLLRLTPHASGSTVTGIKARRGEIALTLVNVGSGPAITLTNQDSSSVAENRLLIAAGGSFVLKQNESVTITYDNAAGRWRVNGAAVDRIARVVYNPTATSTGTTSSSFADLDAANLVLPFDSPPSGNVLIVLEGGLRISANSGTGGELSWGLREGSSNVSGADTLVGELFGSASDVIMSCRARALIYLTGLSGAKTWKWAHRRPTGTASTSTRYGGAYGPAIMEVYALP